MLTVMVRRPSERSTPVRPAAPPCRGLLVEGAAGVAAGAVGTAVMTATARLHREIHDRRRGMRAADEILDYDDSDHVVVAASTVLRAVTGRAPTSPAGRRALFLLVHWGYGSVVGVAHGGLRAGIGGEPAAGVAFFVGCETMALSLFPLLGETPPPWRWRRDLLVTSLLQHAVYAAAVAATTRVLSPRAPAARSR